MPVITVTTQNGDESQIEMATGSIMMESLRDAGLIDATCGGAASCGTCHVYFAEAAIAGEQTEEEGYMLESLGDFVEIQKGSRLACQVKIVDTQDQSKITIAPEV